MCICFPSHARHAAVLGRTVVIRAIYRSETASGRQTFSALFGAGSSSACCKKKHIAHAVITELPARAAALREFVRSAFVYNCCRSLQNFSPRIRSFLRNMSTPLDSNNFDGEASSTVKKNRAASCDFHSPCRSCEQLTDAMQYFRPA